MAMIDDLDTSNPVSTVAEEARTMGDVLRRRAADTPEATAHLEKRVGRWEAMTWKEYYQLTARAAHGLRELGVGLGDPIAILGPTQVPWAVWDLAGQLLGAVTIGVYPKQSPEQVRYLLQHSESRVVFVADEEELSTVLDALSEPSSVQAIVPWTDSLAERFASADSRIVAPSRILGGDTLDEAAVDAIQARIDPQSPAIFVYTSGTTGPPKAAMISHANILAMMRSQAQIIQFYRDDLLLSFLPMAHATERVLSFYARINTGVAAAYATSIGQVLQEAQEVRPTVFGSVPRIFEKAHAKIHGEMARKPAPVQWLFHWAKDLARRRIRRVLEGKNVPTGLRWQFRLADRLVFAKIRAAFGGRVRACITGAAPISYEILEFFWAVGLPIYEAYGMTESTVVSHINRPGDFKLGTVGKVIPPLLCKIADDGEILLHGTFIFKGYFKDEAATAETVEDGWLKTGDIGEVDAEGFLRITDRKKHLIITAGGKNVAPANIERAIKSQSPLISQVHTHGDRRPYISALIAPSPIETLEWGTGEGILTREEGEALRAELLADPSSRSVDLNRAMARVVEDPRFQRLFLEPVRAGNQQLARVERVRRFAVLDRDFSVEEGELTPTLKMKRKVIEERYSELFDRIYSSEDFGIEAEAGGS